MLRAPVTPASPTHVPARARVIALDVGGTSIKSAMVAPGGRLAGQAALTPIDSSGDGKSILGTFAQVIAGHVAQVEPSDLLGVALGFPGPFDYAEGIGRIKGVKKYEAIHGVNLRAALRRRLGLGDLPILFRNDAEAAAVGEARHGAGRLYRRVIGVTLGTGCGSAFVSDGLPITDGLGVPAQGWLYPMQFHGARADDIFSRRGLEARLRSAGAEMTDVRQAAQSARAGDPTALTVFQAFGTDLGEFLNPFVVTFQAEAVLALGQIAGALDLFGPALRRTLSVPALAGERGADAALLGAADLFFNQKQETP